MNDNKKMENENEQNRKHEQDDGSSITWGEKPQKIQREEMKYKGVLLPDVYPQSRIQSTGAAI